LIQKLQAAPVWLTRNQDKLFSLPAHLHELVMFPRALVSL
jgi:hypothetical protein